MRDDVLKYSTARRLWEATRSENLYRLAKSGLGLTIQQQRGVSKDGMTPPQQSEL